MTHSLILGQTLSGKSTLAKRLARDFKRCGVDVLVYDPVFDDQWIASYKTGNFSDFMYAYQHSRGCMIFIDEAGEIFEKGTMPEKNFLSMTATRGRHFGHTNFYLSQRAVMISRTMRDQCRNLFLFSSGLEDCKIHAADWNAPILKEEGPTLKTGEYFHVKRMGDIEKKTLF